MMIRSKSRLVLRLALIACAAALAGAALLYRNAAQTSKAGPDAACMASAKMASALTPFAKDDLAAFSPSKASKPLPPLAFNGPDGTAMSVQNFAGRVTLLNLWATWCVPCREEMPALDRLQAESGGPDFSVAAINIDTSRLERPKQFLDEIGVKNLAFYTDPKADVFYRLKQAGKVVGLPTTILVGPDGCEIGTIAGPAVWDGPGAAALIGAAVAAK